MDEARLIRRWHFRAWHHYRRPEWSEAENRRVFGAQCEPHAHDWTVKVQVAGPVAADTGWAVDLAVLDDALGVITAGWDGGDLNALVPSVADGSMTPSTENLARWLYHALAARVPPPARVLRVHVFEDPDLGAAYPP